MDFIDIAAASGAAYRFRRWPADGRHPPIAGNYVLVTGASRKVIAIGVLDDLSRAPMVLEGRPARAELFTRLNISRRLREAEHADIARSHPEATVNFGAADVAVRTA